MLKTFNIYLLILLASIGFTNSSKSQEYSATKEKITIVPLSHDLISSSITSSHKFYDPFLIGNINYSDKFSYDYENDVLHFDLLEAPGFISNKSELFIGVGGADIEYVVLQNDSHGLYKKVDNKVLVSPPDNSIFSAAKAALGYQPKDGNLVEMFNLGNLTNAKDLQLHLKIKNFSHEKIILSLIVSKDITVLDEMSRIVFAPLITTNRLLGESNNLDCAFVNYQIEFDSNRIRAQVFNEILDKNFINAGLDIVFKSFNWNLISTNNFADDYGFVEWDRSFYIKKSEYEGFTFKNGKIKSSVSILNINVNEKILLLTTDRTKNLSGASANKLYHLFSFEKRRKMWVFKNEMISKKTYGGFDIIDLGPSFGIVDYMWTVGQGYYYKYAKIFIPSYPKDFNEVLEIQTEFSNSAVVIDKKRQYSWESKISTRSSKNNINDIIVQRYGTDNLNSSGIIESINEFKLYKFNGFSYKLSNSNHNTNRFPF